MPRFPLVVGRSRLTETWSLDLPIEFARRVEDGSLVLWRPGLTFWVNAWNNDRRETVDKRLAWILGDASPQRSAEQIVREADTVRLTYELDESDADPTTPSVRTVSAFVIGATGHLQIAAYCDDTDAIALAYEVLATVCAEIPSAT